MLPTFNDGDWLLAVRAGRTRVNDVVIVDRPGIGLIVKRVTAVRERDRALEVWLQGDNPDASATTDSRDFGWLPETAVSGRVLLRYRRSRTRTISADSTSR